MINVQNVNKSFGSVQAVKDVSFKIQPGEVVGFLGPNGAGKSTTMRMITGYLPPTDGKIEIDGLDITEHAAKVKRKIGYLPESAALYAEMEVTDFLTFMASVRGLGGSMLRSRLKAAVRQCQLEKVLGRKIHELSKGYRQRVGLAQALLHDPDILVLDEPTVGLDPNQIVEIRELIREIGKVKTILLSTHILPEVSATCRRVIIINEGRVVAEGTPESLTAAQMGHSRYQLAIRGEATAIHARLAGIPSFAHAQTLRSAGDLHYITLTAGASDDLSEDIFRLAVENRWSMGLLARERLTLEEVFKQLTSN